jgi:hypothetical protein
VSLSATEKKLLLALKAGRHSKASPAKPSDLLALDGQDANPVGRRLIALGFAAAVVDSARPGALLLRVTDTGISEAEKLVESARKPTVGERFKALPFAKGMWDVFKIGLGVGLGFVATKYFGK